jgi:23S rRNA (guanine2445-N2)-methyltransferase / 23S rRNA (guanine2069-N7)-methyltransferase
LNFTISEGRAFTPLEGGPLSEEEKEHRRYLRRLREVDLTSGGAEMVANRLRKNLKNLGRWARQSGISCYRLYDADLPEYAMAVDLYACEGTLRAHVQEYEAPSTVDPVKAEQRLIEFMAALPSVLEIPPEQVVLKVRKRQRGINQYEKQAEKGHFYLVEEGQLKFRVNLEDYLDTGLFLDHRLTRELLRQRSQGKRFLNLFAYTGSATVYAAAGGARSTLTLDLSNTYLDWAEANLSLNGFKGNQHQFLRADCMAWLEEASEQAERFDLIFLDPPTFSTSKRMEGTLDVQRDHVAMIRACMGILTPEGSLVFTTNQRKFRIDKEQLQDFVIEDISARTLPRDFERNPRIHMGWIIQLPHS